MTDIILKSIKISNFKGIKSAELSFGDKNNTILGQNGSGKTTIRNAWEWVLCQSVVNFVPNIDGKDITETVCVECSVKIGNKTYKIKREKPYGKDYNYYIDDIPTKFRQYKEFIASIFGGNGDYGTLLMLSDKNYFNNELTQGEKEKVLFAMADTSNIADTLKIKSEYSSIFDFLDKGYSINEMQKLLRTERSTTKNKQDSINGTITYLNCEIEDIENSYDFSKIRIELEKANKKLDELILKNQNDTKTDKIEKLQKEIETLTKQQVKISMDKMTKESTLRGKEQQLFTGCLELQSSYNISKSKCDTLKQKIENFNPEINPTCSECGAKISAKKIEQLRQKAQETLQELVDELETETENMNRFKQLYTQQRNARLDILTQINILSEKTQDEIDIETAIISKKTALENEKGELLDNSLTEEINAVREQISKLTQNLHNEKLLDKYYRQVKQLKLQNVELADKLLVIVKKEIVLKEYIQEYTELISEKLNSKFKNGIKWQLFNEKEIDGEIAKENVCICTLNGVAYNSLSNGEKNVANLEIVKSLQEYFDVRLPVWSEDDESITIDYDYSGQIFKLRATKDTTIPNIKMFKKEN